MKKGKINYRHWICSPVVGVGLACMRPWALSPALREKPNYRNNNTNRKSAWMGEAEEAPRLVSGKPNGDRCWATAGAPGRQRLSLNSSAEPNSGLSKYSDSGLSKSLFPARVSILPGTGLTCLNPCHHSPA